MRPRFFIPLVVFADFMAAAMFQDVIPEAIDPIFRILSELPIVGLMIWMFLKIDERHRDTIIRQQEFYSRLLSEMMHFMKDIKAPE